MNRWPEVALHYLVRFGNGADYKDVEDPDGDVPVIGSGGPFTTASESLFDGESVLFGRKGTIDKPRHQTGRFWTVDTMFYTILGPRVNGRWLYYWATTVPFGLYSTSTALPSMTSAVLGRLRVSLPSVPEQRAIADHLDRETALIDELIEKQNALIERLRERRSSLIITAVTGAAEQDRKPANLGWADSVPASWDILPLAYLARITLGKMVAPTPSSDRAVLAPYLRAANVQPDGATALDDLKEMWFEPSELRALTVEAGDVVVVEGGQGGFGRAAFVQDDLLGVGFQNSINRLRPRGSDGRFLAYALIAIRATGYMHAYCDAVSMPHLTAEKLARLRIGAPSLDEQRAIADYLDRETPKIDGLISKVERHIELANERRSALITAAVTGQTKVGAA